MTISLLCTATGGWTLYAVNGWDVALGEEMSSHSHGEDEGYSLIQSAQRTAEVRGRIYVVPL